MELLYILGGGVLLYFLFSKRNQITTQQPITEPGEVAMPSIGGAAAVGNAPGALEPVTTLPFTLQKPESKVSFGTPEVTTV